MRLTRRPALVAALMSVSVAAAACGGSSGNGGGGGSSAANKPNTPIDNRVGKPGGTFRLGIAEPTAIDPYNSQESEGQLVTKNLFDTLYTVNPDGTIAPLAAESDSTNGDCSQWTFKIRGGQTFSNGDPVDAQAFIRGWNRTVAKAAASDVSYHLQGVDGYDAVQNGTAQTMSGLTAPDPMTLQVKLSAPDCEFDKKTAQPATSPVPAVAGNFDNKSYNDQPIGNGPFMMEGPWRHNQGITLVRNPKYKGDGPNGPVAKLDRVEISILPSNTGIDLEYKGIQQGTFDWARIPTELIPQADQTYTPKHEFIKEDTWGINYLEVNVKNPPLNSAAARMAVSYAIDRDAIINGVFKGYQVKATSLSPPVLKVQGTYQPGVCQSCEHQDKAKAKQFAQQAGFTPNTSIDLAYNTGAGHDAWIQAVAQQVRDVLGVKVNILPKSFKDLLKYESNPSTSGLARAAWSFDYPTADNILFPLLGTKPADDPGDNRGRYSNPQVDSLIKQARAEKDPGKRADLYKKAEQIAIGQDLALIPMWYRSQYRVFNNKFVGVNMDFFENPTLRTIGLA